MPGALTLLSKFSGGSSKRVYILLKSDDNNAGTKTFWHLIYLQAAWPSGQCIGLILQHSWVQVPP